MSIGFFANFACNAAGSMHRHSSIFAARTHHPIVKKWAIQLNSICTMLVGYVEMWVNVLVSEYTLEG